MEDNEIKEGILRKSKQIIHPQSETDAALIFWRVKCLHVDMSGHKSHKSCLTKSLNNCSKWKWVEIWTDSFVQPYSQKVVWDLRASWEFENHTCKPHISESIDSDDNLAKKRLKETEWFICTLSQIKSFWQRFLTRVVLRVVLPGLLLSFSPLLSPCAASYFSPLGKDCSRHLKGFLQFNRTGVNSNSKDTGGWFNLYKNWTNLWNFR